jgi:YVTN family beta-propeller protein
MKLCICWLFSIAAFGSCCLGSASTCAENAYITGAGDRVWVVDTARNRVTATIRVGNGPEGVAMTPDGRTVYVANYDSKTVSVIDTARNRVTATIPVSAEPEIAAVTPDGRTVYGSGTVHVAGPSFGVFVIATATNTVTATIPAEDAVGVAVSPDGRMLYVTHMGKAPISVIDTATNKVTATIPFQEATDIAVSPDGRTLYTGDSSAGLVVIATATNTVTHLPIAADRVAVSADGRKVYAVEHESPTIAVIDTATNKKIATIHLRSLPDGIGIRPAITHSGKEG